MWFKKVLDYSGNAIKSNTGISSLSWVLVLVGWLTVITMLTINICMLFEMIDSGTIASSIEGYAAVITALAELVAAVGIPKALNNYSENKFRKSHPSEDEQISE